MGFKIKIDVPSLDLCYKHYNEVAQEKKLTNPAEYKGKLIRLVPDKECEKCNKIIKVNLPNN